MFGEARSNQRSALEASRAAPFAADIFDIDTSKIFGANFKRVREALGLSLDQVAQILGLTMEHLAGIEAGLNGQADFDLVVLITKRLNVSVDDLIKGIG